MQKYYFVTSSLNDDTSVESVEGFQSQYFNSRVVENAGYDALSQVFVHVIGPRVEVSDTMKRHLHQLGEMSDQLHDVHAALGFVHQELQVGEVVTVAGPGGQEPLHRVLVDIAQQVLLVPDMILSRHSQVLQLSKVKPGKGLICEQICGQL